MTGNGTFAGGDVPGADESADAGAYLDLLLSYAALGLRRRFVPGGYVGRLGLRLARRPRTVARRVTGLAGRLESVAAGRSAIAPDRRDRRFADPAWTQNPVLRRIMQAYLAGGEFATGLLDDAGLDGTDAERAQFLVENVVDALAPSNNPLLSPVAWKAAIDTGGLSAVRGLRAFAGDMASAPRVPSMVEPDAFEVGRDLAVTPGAVAARTEICELIQYEPSTPRVNRFPVVVVPPTINKFYITDLAPGRSMIEYLVSQGHQVFAISWRNPDARHKDWGLDAYGQAVLSALETARTICEAEQASILSLCSGGIISAMAAAYLAGTGSGAGGGAAAGAGLESLASLFCGVTMLDPAANSGPGALISQRTLDRAVAVSQARGYLDGRALAEVFAWLRPNDLIWNYWVNNYLQGRTPPPFDILFWNADTTRMTAALHRDFIRLFSSGSLGKPGAATMLGTPVDLSAVTVDVYVVAGISDHLCPWEGCYSSGAMFGGDVRFALSTSGHIASMVNPPGNPKARFRAAPASGSATDWLAATPESPGSWWTDYSPWLGERSGGTKDSPGGLGGNGFTASDPAPGRYVLDR
jgi:polyhydroxyalkanoate synthase subunit PhaC